MFYGDPFFMGVILNTARNLLKRQGKKEKK